VKSDENDFILSPAQVKWI